MRKAGILAGALVLVLALPAPAGAARVTVTGTTGPLAESFLIYRADLRESNRVSVNFAREGIVIVDRGTRRIAVRDGFERCRATSRQRVVCPPYDMVVELRDRDDTLRFAQGADRSAPARTNPLRFAEPDNEDEESEGGIVETAIVTAGPGDDRIRGTQSEDYINAGTGRDVVDGRGGADTVVTVADGVADRLRGGGGVDGLVYSSSAPVTIDRAAGTGGAAGETDTFRGFERLHGGLGDDVLRGDDGADALYGGSGNDLLDGRGGSDLLVGDRRPAHEPWPNRFVGGDGDDYIDATSGVPAPTSDLDCGPGDDVVTGEDDDLLDPSCESSAFRFLSFYDPASWSVRTPAWPVGRTPDGSPVYEFHCPVIGTDRTDCQGRITLASRPGTSPVTYGTGEFRAARGESVPVPVALTDEGRAAIASGEPVAVHLRGTVRGDFEFGWQQVLSR